MPPYQAVSQPIDMIKSLIADAHNPKLMRMKQLLYRERTGTHLEKVDQGLQYNQIPGQNEVETYIK